MMIWLNKNWCVNVNHIEYARLHNHEGYVYLELKMKDNRTPMTIPHDNRLDGYDVYDIMKQLREKSSNKLETK